MLRVSLLSPHTPIVMRHPVNSFLMFDNLRCCRVPDDQGGDSGGSGSDSGGGGGGRPASSSSARQSRLPIMAAFLVTFLVVFSL